MSGPQQAIVFLIFLGVLVTVHELGHFLAAKWAGVKVVKFSVGFGPRIVGFRRGETEYQIAWVPLGGYVKMHGDYPGEEHDLDDPDRHRGLYAAPWWKRAVIMSAGPAFNLIFPVFAYFAAFLGDQTYITPRVGFVAEDMPAAIAGIKPGDVITRVNGVEIVHFNEISEALADTTSSVPVTVKRGGQELTFQLDPVMNLDESNPVEKTRRGMLGIGANSNAPVIGVPSDSVAARAGLRTFDRIVKVNGQAVFDELQLAEALSRASDTLAVEVIRAEQRTVAGLPWASSSLVTVTLQKQPGEGYAALGGESSQLYVDTVFPGGAAALAGVKPGDRLVAFNDVPLRSLFLLDVKLRAQEGRPFALTWRSGGEDKRVAEVQRLPERSYDEFKNERTDLIFGAPHRSAGRYGSVLGLGSAPSTFTVTVGPAAAMMMSLKQVPVAIRLIGLVLAKLFTGGVPLDAVGGPIAVFQVAAKSAEAGLDTYLMNMAMVSVNLGLVNLLPIPIFDGFALLAALWEGIRRRPIPIRVREYANLFGLVVIAMLLVLVFKNDITKLFR